MSTRSDDPATGPSAARGGGNPSTPAAGAAAPLANGTAQAVTPTRHPLLATVGITFGSMIIVLDTAIVTVAMPHMQGGLSASQDQISWVVTVYLVTLAIMTPPTGWFARHFGRKRLYLTALGVFAAASMVCGTASSLETVLVARIVQAAFGAVLLPLTQATLLDIHPPRNHARALALWSFGVTFGPFLGPTLGGFVADAFGWRECFFIAVPFCVVAFVLTLVLVPDKQAATKPRFSVTGFALLSLGLGGLQIMLDRGQRADWFASDFIVAAAISAGFGLVAFAMHSGLSREPFFQPQLLRDRNFVAATFLFFVLGLVQFTTLTLMPSFLHDLLGYSPLLIGIVLSPRALGSMTGSLIYGFLPQRTDPRLLAGAGLLCIFGSYVGLMQATDGVDVWFIAGLMVLQGFGVPLIFVTLNKVGFATLSNDLRAEAASVFNLLRGIGGSMGVAILVALLTRSIQTNHAELSEHIHPFNDRLAVAGHPALWDPAVLQGLAALDHAVNHQATLIAYINNFWFMAVLLLASLPLLLILGGSRHRPPD